MKLILSIGSILFSMFAAQAQISWQNPNLSGERMNAVEFISPSIGWVSGDAGMLLKTVDGGGSWSKISLGICEDISGIHFVNSNEGWLIGGQTLYHSLDGGTSWVPFPVMTYQSIGSMNFISPTSWFLSCEGGLLFTADNGSTWELKNPVIGTTFAFANPRKGWQVAPFGGIKYTTDGGVLWVNQTSGVSENILDICILDSNEVWMSGVSGLIHTTNAGTNWTINTSSRAIIGTVLIFTSDCHFLNPNVGWAISPLYESVIITTDGGISWTRKTISGNKVFGLDPVNGFIIGDRLFQTTNGGNSFTNELNPVTENDLFAVDFADNSTGISVGAGGTILRTTNSGQQWNSQISGTTSDLNGLFMLNSSEAWIVGNLSDSILHTVNGGISWQRQATGSNDYLMGVYFTDNQSGWAVGINGTILHTTNGGQNWSSQVSNTSLTLQSVFFIDANTGWIVGDSGLILRTVDGGTTWTTVGGGTTGYLSDVYFVSATTGWAVGEATTILHTVDGGLNWNVQPVSVLGDAFALNAVHFLNSQVGWVTGFTPSAFHTSDGGLTWLPVDCAPVNRQIYDVCLTDNTHGWLVGERGAVVFSGAVDGEMTISEFAAPESLEISPNPSSTFVTIHSNEVLEMIEIRDLNGRLVKQLSGTGQIPVADLQSGLYYICASSKHGTLTGKFLKW